MGLDSARVTEKMGDFEGIERRQMTGEPTESKTKANGVCAKTADFAFKIDQEQESNFLVESMHSFFHSKAEKSLELLEEYLCRCNDFHPNYEKMLKGNHQNQVSSSDRTKAVNDLRCLHVFYHFTPETFALAINLLDRFLIKIRARPKYLSCIAITCYFIAIKTCEESQNVPRLVDLLTIGQCKFKSSDILRMEAIILEKLNFDLNAVTTLKLLENYFRILEINHPWVRSYLMIEVIISRLEVCLSHISAVSYQAHILALSVIHHALQESGLSQDTTIQMTMTNLQTFSMVNECDLLQCLRNIKTILDDYLNCISQTPKSRLQWRMSSRTFSQIKRPSLDGYSELPIISEIKPFSDPNELNMSDEINNNFTPTEDKQMFADHERCPSRQLFFGEA